MKTNDKGTEARAFILATRQILRATPEAIKAEEARQKRAKSKKKPAPIQPKRAE